MDVSTFLQRVNYAFRGTDDDAPDIGDDDANFWISTLNRKKNELYRDTSKQWRTTYKAQAPVEPGTVATAGTTTLTGTGTYFTDYRVGDKIVVSGETVRTIATISSDTSLTVTSAFSNTASALTFSRQIIIEDGVLEYNLHRDLITPSDRLYVVKTDGQKSFLGFDQPQTRDYVNRIVSVVGVNPQAVIFSQDIESTDQLVGGQLYVPGYYMPADVSAATDLIPLPDPEWGVMAVAAEASLNDITYEDKSADLQAMANSLYKAMVRNNRRGTYGNPRTVPTNVKTDFDPEYSHV